MAPKKAAQTSASTQKGQSSRGKSRITEYESDDYSGSDEEYFPEEGAMPNTAEHKKRKVAQPNVLQKFINADAQLKFCEFSVRHIHIERAFLVTESPYMDAIRHYKWERLVQAPDSCNVAIAKEFYANAAGVEDEEVKSKGVFVRDKYLKLTSQLINKHYGLQDYQQDDLEVIRSAGDPNSILSALSLPGVDWTRTRHGHPRYVHLKDLLAETKTWLLFINSRLMPTTHTTHISKDRLCLVYAIKNRLTVDVGRLMLRYIGNALADEHQALYFPLFLNELAIKAGIKLTAGEENRSPQLAVRNGQVTHYLETEKADRARLEVEAVERERLAQAEERERGRLAQEQLDDIDVDVEATQPQQQFNQHNQNQQSQQLGNFHHMQQVLQGMQASIQNQQNSLEQHMENMEGRWTGLRDCMGIIGTRIESIQQEQTTQWTVLDNKITQCQTEVHNLNLRMVHHHQTRGPDSYFPPLEELESRSRMIVDTSSTTRVVMQQELTSNAGSAAPNFKSVQSQFPGFAHFSSQPPPGGV